MENVTNGDNQVCVVSGNDMIKINSIEEIKQAFEEACFGDIHLGLGKFESLKLYGDAEVINNLPSKFESDGEKILINKNSDNTISLTRHEDVIFANIQNLFGKFTTIKQMTDEYTYSVDCSSFGNYIGYALDWLKNNNKPLINNKYIDVITVNQEPNMKVIDFERSANYVVIIK